MRVLAFPELAGPRVQLRRFQADDLAPFMAYRNDPAVARFQSWDGIDEAAAERFIAQQSRVETLDIDQWVQIAISVDGRLVGDCALKLTDEGRQAEIGFTLATAAQGQGLASEAVGLLIRHAFSHWNLHRITATTDALNESSVALLERLGFRREGHYHKRVPGATSISTRCSSPSGGTSGLLPSSRRRPGPSRRCARPWP